MVHHQPLTMADDVHALHLQIPSAVSRLYVCVV